MKKINPYIIQLIEEDDKNLSGITVTGDNCISVMRQMAFAHLVNKSSNGHHKKHKRSEVRHQLLSTQ